MATYKHIRSSTAHKRPTTAIADGQIAINTNTASPGLFFKDSAGTGIVKVGPVHVGTTAPNSTPAAGGSSGNYLGEQWLDTGVSPAQMKVWNGSAWVAIVADELPVAKLQDGNARQLLQTDAAGTGVEWTNNVDVPGTLDVTGATTLDSTLTVPLGSAASPTLRFSGDANTGVYSPGADQVALSTNGTGRLFVGATGNVGIGATSPSRILHVSGADGSSSIARFNGASYAVRFQSIAATGAHVDGTDATEGTYQPLHVGGSDLRLTTSGTERARIDSSGRLLVGTSSARANISGFAAGTGASNIQQESTTEVGASLALLLSRNAAAEKPIITLGRGKTTTIGSNGVVASGDDLGAINFAGNDGTNFVPAAQILAEVDGTPGTNDMPGRLVFSTTPDGSASPVERMRITSAGLVGIGTTSPAQALHVSGGNLLVQNSTDQTPNANFDGHFKIAGNGYSAGITLDSAGMWVGTNTASRTLIFATDETERARVDGFGRLLVGTSADSGGALLQVNGNRIRVATAKTPASATDTGTAGEICWDANYIYVCTATNTWKRTALSTW